MENVAVFPVPDWACAMTSWPSKMLGGNGTNDFKDFLELTLDDWHDSALLDSRRALKTVGIDTCIMC